MGEMRENPLGTEKIQGLILKFAIPSIIAMLVTSVYNIVDQFFIGQCVGALGNAATSVYYPFTTACIGMSLLCGVGGAAAFNLAMGMGKKDEAGYYIGNAFILMLILSVIIMAAALIFTKPLLLFFGSSEEVLPYAMTYTRVCAIGFPALILQSGGTHLVRADGRPNASMSVNLVGAGINVVLDALFVFVFGWGMAGAAAATVIGQVFAAALLVWYILHFRTLKLAKEMFRPNPAAMKRLSSLGMANCFTQMAIVVVIIATNKSLKYYGAQSVYGESIPVAIAGIATKCMQLVMAVVIGFSQGMQPVTSFNYGAQKYDRVKKAYLTTIRWAAVVPIIAYIFFQLFPRQLIGIFGTGEERYFAFGAKYIHIAYLLLFTYFLQPITGNFFSSIGKPQRGVILSLSRQILFFLPLLLLLPVFLGIEGVMWATCVSDAMAFTLCLIMIIIELRRDEYRM